VLDPSVALGSSSRERKQLASSTGSNSLIFFTHGNGSYPWSILTSGLALFYTTSVDVESCGQIASP
jgi:hypothetical protein